MKHLFNYNKYTWVLKSAFVGVGALLFSACSDFLTIYPTDKIVLENYWQEKADVQNMVANSYRIIASNNFMRKCIVWGELRGDNVVEGDFGGNVDLKNINEANLLPTNGYCDWSTLYEVINNCNIVMKYAPQVMELDPDYTIGDYKTTKGEMLALRALCHFYLVRTFRNIPLLTEAMVDDSQNLYQKQVPPLVAIDCILDDLKEAEYLVLASGSYTSDQDNKGLITRDAVRAMIADVLLWKAAFTQYEAKGSDAGCRQYYSECIDMCDSVINAKNRYVALSESKLNTTTKKDKEFPIEINPLLKEDNPDNIDNPYTAVFGDGNNMRESIFEIQYFDNERSQGNAFIPYFYGGDFTNNPLLQAAKDLATANEGQGSYIYKTTDMRRTSFVKGTKGESDDSEGKNFITKYTTRSSRLGTGGREYDYVPVIAGGERYTAQNWIVYRATDVMLMKAEALALRGDTTTNDLKNAFKLVSKVYYRSNPYDVSSKDSLSYDPANLTSLVLEERQRELCFEGKRWYDLVRKSLRDGTTENMLEVMVARKYEANHNAIKSKLASIDCLFFPIAERELNANPLLKQNPAYVTESIYDKK